MIRVNKKHAVQYKNGYFYLREFGIVESGDNKGNESIKATSCYPDIGSMIMQCGFDMGYEYTDAVMKSKSEYEKKWNDAHLKAKAKKLEQEQPK